ncbi:tripartite tricarboxylate transporter TctB family protein [Aliiruegeria lutimaris]|uniref:Putative tricarboxylic transport membrane protein n=1 Tax=Aliiruegeria lutimaris TaxID=571298 RepID=A0A1G9HWX5_9RHOB|nr:tripartite tricarboxylate transporter TctB family protein [Aliiruegeria lutimaris]SDL17468.1 putative tricarboxylic transport membrane protein [Aliiruegeria lutimaris]
MSGIDERPSDTVIGMGLLAFCAFAAWRTLRIKVQAGSTIAGPSFLPWLMIVAISVFSIIMIVRALRREHGETIALPDRAALVKIGIFIVLLVAYAAAFMPVGYLISTFAVFIAGLWLFGERRILMLTLFPVAMVGTVYLGFTEVLKVWLP